MVLWLAVVDVHSRWASVLPSIKMHSISSLVSYGKELVGEALLFIVALCSYSSAFSSN